MFMSAVSDVERRSALHVWNDPTEQTLSWTANGHSHARSHDIPCLYRIRSLLLSHSDHTRPPL